MLAPAQKRPPRPPTIETAHMPAPIGGINTVDAGSAMPPTDCVYLYNMVPAEYGLRSRLGYQEWCTGLTGSTDNTVRSILPFTGNHKSGSSNALFASTSSGIWDVSATSATPSQLVTFGVTTGDAGFGTWCVMATPAGRFFLLCDEENGLYIYSENSTTWTKVVLGTTQLWQPSTVYLVGNKTVNGGNEYIVTSEGESASSGGPSGTGTGISDGTVTWNYVGAAATGVIGPSLADQQAGFSGDPANFAFVAVWKSRVWLVERDSTRAWYLDVNSIFGTATSFDFGGKMRAGGPLVGLYDWSYDSGGGLDSLLVGISTAGDVVIYQGTDPTSATTFGLKGAWFVGGVPYGRRIATDYGGDILILSTLGVISLSKLIVGQPVVAGDRSFYATGKIANLFNNLVSTSGTLQGWSLHVHPTDNVLLIAVPSVAGQATTQLAMSFVTKGWGQYRDLPLLSAGVWNGTLYFGTADGRVCINTGYVDDVQLADSNQYMPVAWSVLSSFQNLGSARNKRVESIRPILESQSPSPLVQVTAKYDFDLSEPPPPTGAASGTGSDNTWDDAKWDGSLWGGDYNASQALQGATGMGRFAAIAARGSAVSRTLLVGFDVFFQQGGLL